MSNDSTRGATSTRWRAAAAGCRRPVDAGAGRGLSVDLAAAFDAAFDQVAHGEAHIGFEALHARRAQSLAHAGNVCRGLDLDAATVLPSKLLLVVGLQCGRAGGQRLRGIGGADVEVRPLPVVAHQEAAAFASRPYRCTDGERAPGQTGRQTR